ncbi:hypothetical protein ACJJTC_011424 [Scirpophaga incertulas]
MGVFILFLVTVLVRSVYGQDVADCYGAGSVAGAAIGAFIAALLLVAVAYYLRRLYWKSRKEHMPAVMAVAKANISNELQLWTFLIWTSSDRQVRKRNNEDVFTQHFGVTPYSQKELMSHAAFLC